MISNHISHASKKLSQALSQIPIQDLLKHKRNSSFAPLQAFDEATPIKDVLFQLQQSQILACPVFRMDSGEKMYTGIVSVYDILSFAVFEEIFDSSREFSESNLFDYLNRIDVDEFFSTPVSKVIGASQESASPWIVYSTDNLDDLTKLFTTSKQHRVLVVDSDILVASLVGPIPPTASLSIVTQSDLIRYIFDSKKGLTKLSADLMEPILDVTVRELTHALKSPNQPIIAMLDTQSALHGFRTMYLDSIQGVPVIDRQGNVVCNLSASDLRGITIKNMQNLSKPVFQYLESMKHKGEVMADQLRTVELSDTVDKVLKMVIENKIHRLWVTQDNSEKLGGVVSLTDILSLLQPIRT
jgi:CBS-domain-containing membrane protein